jgi:DNA-binding MarR family transcriptional regulator
MNFLRDSQTVDVDEIIHVSRMLHLMRSIPDTKPGKGRGRAEKHHPTKESAGDASVEAILTEVGAWVGELRCASMGRLLQGQVSMSQLHVLWLLQHQGAMTMSRLAELLGVSLSNATGIIDRMETNQLIERVRIPDDRRVVLVQPATAGRQALSETESTKREAMRSVMRRLSPAERPVVLEALRSLRRALSAEVEATPATPETTHRHHFESPN